MTISRQQILQSINNTFFRLKALRASNMSHNDLSLRVMLVAKDLHISFSDKKNMDYIRTVITEIKGTEKDKQQIKY